MTFDPTTNRVPYGLLTDDERKALQEWPHGIAWYSPDGEWGAWTEVDDPRWYPACVYRGKPAPKRIVTWVNVYSSGAGWTCHSPEEAKSVRLSTCITVFRIEYNEDGSDPAVFVEGLE